MYLRGANESSTFGIAAALGFDFIITRMFAIGIDVHALPTADGFSYPGASLVWGLQNLSL
jgi:hypothetical protein